MQAAMAVSHTLYDNCRTECLWKGTEGMHATAAADRQMPLYQVMKASCAQRHD